ncbi:MAG: XRE family transcriptional regulator, partial [Thiohalomonadaceae bacterium]
MDKRLNLENLKSAMERAGLSPAAVARELSVSRESVSKWLNGESLPRPDKLLRLGKRLGLPFADLVIREEANAPIVAFRRMKGTKTRDHHIERAQTMGRMLRHLVPYLPSDRLAMPPVLKEPRCEYGYLQQVAAMIRQEIHVEPLGTVDFAHLIRHFRKLQAVVIPVLWGSKQRHENATHIFLPDSQTTWVYLNLDVNVHDFKFWMAHELGHCLAPSLRGDEAEDFADAFAGMLLFPTELAEACHARLARLKSEKGRLGEIMKTADEHIISPWTVYKQTNAYAKAFGKHSFNLDQAMGPWVTRFNAGYLNVSNSLFSGSFPPEATSYVEVAT